MVVTDSKPQTLLEVKRCSPTNLQETKRKETCSWKKKRKKKCFPPLPVIKTKRSRDRVTERSNQEDKKQNAEKQLNQIRKKLQEIRRYKENRGTTQQTYHRSDSSERSGMSNQTSQGVLLPRTVDYVSIICHHDGHLLHHFDSLVSSRQREGGEKMEAA